MSSQNIRVVIAGNPNCGKTSVFNALTGLNQQVSNYAGTTVDKKTGYLKYNKEQQASIIDLPGTYSIYPRSRDEEIAIESIIDPKPEQNPDLFLIIADASNLKRNLLFFSQVADLKKPMVLVLTMLDIAEKKGLDINLTLLSLRLGVKVVGVNPRTGMGIDKLKNTIFNTPQATQTSLIDIVALAPEGIASKKAKFPHYTDYQCLLALHRKDRDALNPVIQKETLFRFKAIDEILKEGVVQKPVVKAEFSNRIDKVLTHRIWGYAFFLLILFLIFESIFTISAYPMEWIEQSFIWFGNFFAKQFPKGPLNDLMVNGVLAGLSGVVVFLPQIILLFAFIAILEDSGYMARVSFMMDRIMRKVGMNGRSVVPLISGVACAVPSIMATRSIENWKERLITIMVIPLLSCSARLPVYTLLLSLVVPQKYVWGIFNYQGLLLMGMYLLGFFMAIFAAFVMSKLVKTTSRDYYIMELPTYKAPRLKNIFITLVEKSKTFLFEAGKVIVAVSVVLWLAASFGPPGSNFEGIEKTFHAEKYSQIDETERQNLIKSEKLKASYAGAFGRFIEPAIQPLGFDWKIGISLFSSLAAREVFVGTMATIYSLGDEENSLSIKEKMTAEINSKTGKPQYSTAVAFSLMVFYAFAMQCISTIAVVYRETKGWKWPIIQFIYMTALAYLASLFVFQVFG